MMSIYRSIKISLSLTLCLLLPTILPARSQIDFKSYQIDRIGLQGTYYIGSIFQDSKGMLWISTGSQLYQYDGYSINKLEVITSGEKSSSHLWLSAIFEDSENKIWIGGKNCIYQYNKVTEDHTPFIFNSNSDESDLVSTIYEIPDSHLWIGTRNGYLIRYNKKDKKFVKALFKPKANSQRPAWIDLIRQDNTGRIWVVVRDHGLYQYDFSTKQFRLHDLSVGGKNILPASIKRGFFADGKIWLYCVDLVTFDLETESAELYNIGSIQKGSDTDVISDLAIDDTGIIWIGARYAGIILLNKETKDLSLFEFDYKVPTKIFKDRTGNLFIGTFNEGLYKVKKRDNNFEYHSFKGITSQNIVINSIVEDSDDNLWLGSYSANPVKVMKYSPKTGTSKSYQPDNAFYYIDNMHRDRAGVLWACASDHILKYDEKSDRFVSFSFGEDSDKGINDVMTIFEDSRGRLWVGTSTHNLTTDQTLLSIFDRQHEKFQRLDSLTKLLKIKGTITAVYEDRNGALWITSFDGIRRIDNINKMDIDSIRMEDILYYRHNPNDANSLPNNSVHCVYEDSTTNIWFGTTNSIIKFIKGTEIFKSYSAEGLSRVKKIVEDNNGTLWMSTINGIFKFIPDQEKFTRYGIEEGLPSIFYTNGVCKTNKGELLFGTKTGIVSFFPENIKENLIVPQIVITDFKLFNESVKLDSSLLSKQHIILPYNQNFFTFEFSALDFTLPQKNQYAYRLEGFDEDWIYGGTNHFASYTNVNPGEYVFKVKGSNNDQIWNEGGISISITVLPPWWKTTWAYALYLFLIIGILYSLRRYEMNRVKLKHNYELKQMEAEKYREVNEMKSNFFANISHEFRTPLTLIKGPIDRIRSKVSNEKVKTDLNMMERNANRLLQLINQLLDLSKIESKNMKLEASEVEIISLLKGITMSFESLALLKEVQLNFSSSEKGINTFVDRDKIEKIIYNLLSNAIKFTDEGGEVNVSITLVEKNTIKIEITDTGIGIPADRLDKIFNHFYQIDGSRTRERGGTGIGLALTRELVELHHGNIKVMSRVGEGSVFTVELPVGKEYLGDDEIVGITEPVRRGLTANTDEYLAPSAPRTQEYTEVENENKTIILVVEDNADVREYIKDSLGDGYLIVEAANGEQAIEKAEEIIPDLIISDVMMPKMDGNELSRKIKNDVRTSHIPLILLTAKSEQESKLEGLETGADDYLIKPFDIKELRIRIKNLISLRRKMQEKFSNGNVFLRNGENKFSSIDETFLNKVLEVAEMHLSEEEFTIEEFGSEVGMSRSQLHRKIKALTGKSPSLYLRSVRLAKAKTMIEQKTGKISEIAYSVGFSSPIYFTRCFKEEYGYPPTDLVK